MRILIYRLILIVILLLSNIAFSAVQQFSAEGEYRLGDHDTRSIAKDEALADAKRKIIEQVGVFIESYVEVNNYQVTKSQITSVASACIRIKSERVEFLENGLLCRVYLTAEVDMSTLETRLPGANGNNNTNESTANRDRDTTNRNRGSSTRDRSSTNRDRNSTNRDRSSTSRDRGGGTTSSRDRSRTNTVNVDFDDLNKVRTRMVNNLSQATSFTAAAEYKLQEVTGITNVGHYDEKGSIANSLRANPEMQKNYRFAELNSFINEVGASRITDILNQQSGANSKERMTWAKNDRAKAKHFRDLAIKDAAYLAKQIRKIISKAPASDRERLRILQIEAEDTIKLLKALDNRNKAMDKVAKKYEKINKIVAAKV